MRWWIIGMLASFVGACAGRQRCESYRPGSLRAACLAQTEEEPTHRFAGSADAAPSIQVLPDIQPAEGSFTDQMKFAWQLAEQAFDIEAPDQPAQRSAQAIQDWADGPLKTWVEGKQHAVESARRELDVAAEQNHRQRIIAGALVGLLYEDVAAVLRRMPVPAELDTEPEIAQIYQEVLAAQASPYVRFAHLAYTACSRNAHYPPDMTHFARFCNARAERLPATSDLSAPPPPRPAVVEEAE